MAGNEFDNLKQTIWNNRLQIALKKVLIYGNLANTDYEGEARKGGTVKISQIGEVDVNDYTAYSDMTFQTLDDAALSLKIDQQKYFAFQLDQTDTVFIPMNLMGKGIDRGVYRIRDQIDQFISGKYGDAGESSGSSTSPIQISSGTVIQKLSEFFEVLTEADIPLENRWITLPPWVFTKLTIAGVDKETPNSDVFENGYIRNVVGFSRLHLTNNITMVNTTTSTILSSSGLEALAYAGAIDGDIRILPAEKRRATNVDGLWVYGAKVVRPDMLGCLYASEVAN
jgi:hypothetical protein